MRISDWSSDVCSSDLDEGSRQRAGKALLRRRRLRPDLADEPLAAGAQQHRTAEALEQRKLFQELPVVGEGLAEADPRVDHHPRRVEAGRHTGPDPSGEVKIEERTSAGEGKRVSVRVNR